MCLFLKHCAHTENRSTRLPGAIGYDETWRLFVNVSREELHGSSGLGQRKTIKKES
jgi:hypothetical protein